MTLLTFMVFGAVLAPVALGHLGWPVVIFAVLSLTLLRMVPVALGLVGARLRPDTILFLGWFGPRGLASILFALLVVEEFALAAGEEILVIVMATVLLSVFAHGLTSYPGAQWYAARLEQAHPASRAEEQQAVSEMPMRHALHG